jgi:hypothetical protein
MSHAATWLVSASGLVLASALVGCPSQDVVLEQMKPDAGETHLEGSSMKQDAGTARDAGADAARDAGPACKLPWLLGLVVGLNCHVPNDPRATEPLFDFLSMQPKPNAESADPSPCDLNGGYVSWDNRVQLWGLCQPYCTIVRSWVNEHPKEISNCLVYQSMGMGMAP